MLSIKDETGKIRGRTQVYTKEHTFVRALQTIKCKYLELDIPLVQDKYIRAYSIKVPLIFDWQHICCLLDVFRDISCLVKKHYQKSSLKLISSTCPSVWLTKYLLCLVDSRHTSGYELRSSSRRLVPLFLWGRLHTGPSKKNEKIL
jgi:hypothetical protein